MSSSYDSKNKKFLFFSSEFSHNEEIPIKYTCEGSDISPPLEWSHPPEGTKSLALIVDDPDAPDPKNPKRTWVHWVLFNIPTDINSFSEGIQKLPAKIQMGLNDWLRTGYGGPCPPIGRHRYFFKLFALDKELNDLHQPNKLELEAAMKGHIIEKVEFIGTYKKRK